MTIFSNGTEAMIWLERNCMQCHKYDPESAIDTTCDFSNRVCLGFFGEAPTAEEFKKFGYTGDIFFDCNEQEYRETQDQK